MPIPTAPLTTALNSRIPGAPPLLGVELLTGTAVKAALGGISEMTLWRWTNTLGFPAPDLIIARRKFWRPRTIEKWLAQRETQRAE